MVKTFESCALLFDYLKFTEKQFQMLPKCSSQPRYNWTKIEYYYNLCRYSVTVNLIWIPTYPKISIRSNLYSSINKALFI